MAVGPSDHHPSVFQERCHHDKIPCNREVSKDKSGGDVTEWEVPRPIVWNRRRGPKMRGRRDPIGLATILLLTTLLSAALPHPGAVAAERPLFAGCGNVNQLQFAPVDVLLTGCVPNPPQRVAKVRWKRWGVASATGSGTLENLEKCGFDIGCPSTSLGTVSIVFDRPRKCSAGLLFLRVTISSLRSPKVIRRFTFPCPGPTPLA
jgi:hypothetical protein